MHPHTSGFVVRVRWAEGRAHSTPHITLQNVSTKEVLTLSSWSELLAVMQQPPNPLRRSDEVD